MRFAAVLVLAAAAAFFAPARAAAEEFGALPGAEDAIAAFRARMAEGFIAASQGADPLRRNPDVSAYPVRGVDVSHLQNSIDWDKVKASGVSFAYIKATEGVDFADPMFLKNWQDSGRAGILRGAYHFYNFCRSGAKQAAYFVQIAKPEPGALPPVIDLEQNADCPSMPSREDFQAALAAFVQKVEAAYGRPPMLYVNDSIYDAYIKGGPRAYSVWVTDAVHAAPKLSDGGAWTMWQYAYFGKVPGISGTVDLNVFNGTPQMLAGLARPTSMVAGLVPALDVQ